LRIEILEPEKFLPADTLAPLVIPAPSLVIPAKAGIQRFKIPPPAGTPFKKGRMARMTSGKGRIIAIPPFLKEVARSDGGFLVFLWIPACASRHTNKACFDY